MKRPTSHPRRSIGTGKSNREIRVKRDPWRDLVDRVILNPDDGTSFGFLFLDFSVGAATKARSTREQPK